MQNNIVPGARTPPVEKTLKRYNDHIPLLIFSVISQVQVPDGRLVGTACCLLPVEPRILYYR